MDVLEKIDRLRRDRGWSVNCLAMESMLTQSTLNNLYMRHAEPKLSTLRAICQAFGITLAEFFAEEQEEKEQQDDTLTEKEKNKRLDDELIEKVTSLKYGQKAALLAFLHELE